MIQKCKIYKFDFINKKSKSKNEDFLSKSRWERAKELSAFKRALIDNFCQEKFEDLAKYTVWANALKIKQVEYKSPRGYVMFDSFEIGMDMLHTQYKMSHEMHWNYLYFKVPIEQTKLIEYFDKNSPSWVTTVSKI